MSDKAYQAAERRNGKVIVFPNNISKNEAMRRIKKGRDVMARSTRTAATLSEAVSQGQGEWRDDAHGSGMYRHFHDVKHEKRGHIFYGQPA